jgi:UrcA family protein
MRPARTQVPRDPPSPSTLGDHDLDTKANVSTRPSGLIALSTVAVLALSATFPGAAMADQLASNAPETRIVRVVLADLDLSTPEGARIARNRLQEAARQLCVRLAESRDVGRQWHLRACMNETVADAWRQLSTPALVSVRNLPASPNVAGK